MPDWAALVPKAWIFWLTIASRPDECWAQSCPLANPIPLVWRFEEGKRAAFIVGESNIPSSTTAQTQVVQGPFAQALKCADVAYFPNGCSLTDTSNVTGVGNYMAHCAYYPVVREKDTISERLSPSALASLKDGLKNLATYAPPECKQTANEFYQSVQTIGNSSFRKTLLHVFHEGLKSIDPLWCNSRAETNMDTYLREQWGKRKPIFGLEDVSVECQAFQGNTVLQDEELARWMGQHLTDEWITKVSSLQEAMEEVMRCGDIVKLQELMAEMKELPLDSERRLQYRTDNLNFGVHKALEANPGKNMLFVIPLTHLVDGANKTGLISLLAKDNIKAVRAERDTMYMCQASGWQAPGAAALDHCLKPPAQSQPPSCIQFEKQFGEILGKDVMHGRSVEPGPRCTACVNSSESCSCQMQWSNYENFVNLCESTQVDGSHGRVYYLDMVRNPGSVRSGTALAEKTVAGLYQNCYASSCEIPIIQQMATRNWYKNDPALDLGSVTIRRLDQPFGYATAADAGPVPWWPWIFVAIAVAMCIGCLVKWFHMPRRSQSARKANSWEGEYDTSLKGDASEMQPLKQYPPMPMRAGDGSWTMSEKRYARDVQDLPTLPTDVDIQMPDMQQFAVPSGPQSGHRRVISQTRPAVPSVPQTSPAQPMQPAQHVQRAQPPQLAQPAQPAVLQQQYSLPMQGNSRQMMPSAYTGSPVGGSSLQGYQGSLGMPVMQAAPAGDGSLLALSQHMASQIESSGAEAIRSLRHGQLQGQAVGQVAPGGSQPVSYVPHATPVYQPVAQVPYPYR